MIVPKNSTILADSFLAIALIPIPATVPIPIPIAASIQTSLEHNAAI